MAIKTSAYPITSFDSDWGKNSRDRLPQSVKQMREFLGTRDKSKIGYRYEDNDNDRYLYFADEADCNKYLSDPDTYAGLLKWYESMNKAYTAEIYLTSEQVNNILSGSTGNYIDFTFAVLNRQGQASGDSVVVKYTITSGTGSTQEITEIYNAGDSVHFCVDDYLADGTNSIQISLKGRTSLASTTQSITYNVIAITIASDFDITKARDKGEEFSFIIKSNGSGVKYIETKLDGTDISESTDNITALKDGSITKVISLASTIASGKHVLEIRAYITSGSTKYYSQTIHYEFAVKGGTTEVLLLEATLSAPAVTPTLKVTQYDALNIAYAIYDPQNRSSVTVKFNDGSGVFATKAISNGTKDTVTYTPDTYGTKTITAKVGATDNTFSVLVSKSSINMEKATNGLLLELLAKGRSNTDANKESWNYSPFNATFNNVPFNERCGWVNNALVLSGGATVSINIAPLSNNVATTGVTFEIDYEVDNGNTNDDATIIDLKNDTTGAGISMTPTCVNVVSTDRVSNNSGIRHLTMTGSRKKLAIVINRNKVDANKGIYYTIVNGKIGYAQNYTTASPFLCSKTLTIGDSTGSCTVRIYGIRVYNRALSIDEELGNYAIDSGNVFTVASRNDLYVEGTSTISFDKTKLKVASMKIIGDVQKLLSVQDKTTTITADVIFYDPSDINKYFKAVGVKIKNQGTSTLKFPVKNFSLNFTSAKFYDYLGNEIEVTGIKLHANSAPVLKLVAKCDYMESSSSFNTSGAISFNDTGKNTQIGNDYPLRTKAQAYAASHNVTTDIRTAIDGVAIALFYQQSATSNEVCIGQYNLNNGKDDCPEAYGFKGLTGYNSSLTERWELAEEGGMCAFTAEAFENFDEEYDKYFEIVWGNSSPTNLKRLCAWLASLDKGDGTYDITKFNAEYSQYLDPYKTAHYYNHIFVKNMGVDQVAKNMHLMTEDGNIWFPIYYDGDSAKLNDNDGYQYENLYADRQTKDANNNYYFQAHDSVLWNCVEGSTPFMNIVKQVIAAEYSAGFNYETEVKHYITDHTALFPERIINQNAESKYFTPFRSNGTNYLYVCQGTKDERVKLIADRRLKRYEALWGFGGYSSRAINFRMITGNNCSADKITVKAFDKYYFNYSSNLNMVGNGVELLANATHQFTLGEHQNGDILRVHATDHMSELDMSAFARGLYSIEVGSSYSSESATHLRKLVLGDGTQENTVVSQIQDIAKLTALEYLDIRNFKGITSISYSPVLTTLLASGTSLATFAPAVGSTFSNVSLPNTISDITLNGVTLGTFTYEPTTTLSHVKIVGTTGINTYAFVGSWLALIGDDEDLMANASLEVDGINWTTNAQTLLKIASIGSVSLKGVVTLTDNMTVALYNQLIATFGETCFTEGSQLYIKANPVVTVSSNKTTISSGSTAKLTAFVYPSGNGKFHLYDSEGVMATETDGYATSGAVTLNCNNGDITTTEILENQSVSVKAYYGDRESETLSLTITKTIKPTTVTIGGGVDSFVNIGEASFSVSPYPTNATVGISSLAVVVEEVDEKQAVDLDLPSGTLWNKFNLGASSEEDYGLYYAWGETRGYNPVNDGHLFSQANYSASALSSDLTAENDAVTQRLGSEWRMPTKEECEELIANTDMTEVSDYNGTGVAGCKFASKTDATKFIFIPYAGTYIDNTTNQFAGRAFDIRTSTYKSDNNSAYTMVNGSSVALNVVNHTRYIGESIRGVKPSSNS